YGGAIQLRADRALRVAPDAVGLATLRQGARAGRRPDRKRWAGARGRRPLPAADRGFRVGTSVARPRKRARGRPRAAAIGPRRERRRLYGRCRRRTQAGGSRDWLYRAPA